MSGELIGGLVIGSVAGWLLAFFLVTSLDRHWNQAHPAGSSPVESAVSTPLPPGQLVSVPGGSFPADVVPAARLLAEYIRQTHINGVGMAEYNGSLLKALRVVENEVMRREVRERMARRHR